MTYKLESEVWQKECEKDCEKSWGFLLGSSGDMRKYNRHLRRHLFKIILATSIIIAVITIMRVSDDRRLSSLYDMPFMSMSPSNPLIIVITPTYKRPTRLADMTRMANTIRQVPDLHWIVIEDGNNKSVYVENLLQRTFLPYTYLPIKTIPGYPRRGWYQRTSALQYIRKYHEHILNGRKSGVVYFGDDDNSYDIRLFNDYIRNVKKVGLWAVGMVGGTPVESPDVVNGSVVGFRVKWNAKRRFAVDMAGFAVNLKVVLNTTAVFGTSCSRGGGAPETCLLEDMGLERSDIEPFGYEKETEREIMVWHTKTHGASYKMNESDLNNYIYETK